MSDVKENLVKGLVVVIKFYAVLLSNIIKENFPRWFWLLWWFKPFPIAMSVNQIKWPVSTPHPFIYVLEVSCRISLTKYLKIIP